MSSRVRRGARAHVNTAPCASRHRWYWCQSQGAVVADKSCLPEYALDIEQTISALTSPYADLYMPGSSCCSKSRSTFLSLLACALLAPTPTACQRARWFYAGFTVCHGLYAAPRTANMSGFKRTRDVSATTRQRTTSSTVLAMDEWKVSLGSALTIGSEAHSSSGTVRRRSRRAYRLVRTYSLDAAVDARMYTCSRPVVLETRGTFSAPTCLRLLACHLFMPPKRSQRHRSMSCGGSVRSQTSRLRCGPAGPSSQPRLQPDARQKEFL
jgi:hypothetical protein